MFLALAPISGLNPIWSEERDWLPGSPFFPGVENRKGICVVEKTLDFIPGGLPVYWDAFKGLDLTSGSRMAAHSIACFYTLVGVQHRVIHYQWFSNETDARDYQMEMEGSLQWLDAHVTDVISELPRPRGLSVFEASLFCLVEHLTFRKTLELQPYPALVRFAQAFAERSCARRTAYRFDSPPPAA